MKQLTRYMLRNLLVAAVIMVSTLAFALWLTQSLRLFELAINGGAGMGTFLTLIGLTLPRFLIVILPIASAVAILFVYNRLVADSELVVMRAVGISQIRLALPGILVGLGTVGILYLLHFYLEPFTRYRLRLEQDRLQAAFTSVLIREGVFNTINDKLTVYVRERGRNGDLSGLVIYDTRNSALPVTIFAERGVLTEGPQGPQVIVYNGNRQEPTDVPGRLQQLFFERYVIDLAVFRRAVDKHEIDPDEMNFHELMATQQINDPQKKLLAEIHRRLSQPLYGLVIPLGAITILLTGEFNRRGQGQRMAAATLMIVLLQALALTINNLKLVKPLDLLLVYGLPVTMVIVCLVLLEGTVSRTLYHFWRYRIAPLFIDWRLG
jgi:lipopolysaccharide export system permease protein